LDGQKRNSRFLHFATPDFLFRALALANFLRLPLREAVYVAAGGAALEQLVVLDAASCHSQLTGGRPSTLWSTAEEEQDDNQASEDDFD
jgi:hypothetical protein